MTTTPIPEMTVTPLKGLTMAHAPLSALAALGLLWLLSDKAADGDNVSPPALAWSPQRYPCLYTQSDWDWEKILKDWIKDPQPLEGILAQEAGVQPWIQQPEVDSGQPEQIMWAFWQKHYPRPRGASENSIPPYEHPSRFWPRGKHGAIDPIERSAKCQTVDQVEAQLHSILWPHFKWKQSFSGELDQVTSYGLDPLTDNPRSRTGREPSTHPKYVPLIWVWLAWYGFCFFPIVAPKAQLGGPQSHNSNNTLAFWPLWSYPLTRIQLQVLWSLDWSHGSNERYRTQCDSLSIFALVTTYNVPNRNRNQWQVSSSPM